MRKRKPKSSKEYYLEKYKLKTRRVKVVASGISVGRKIVTGKARVMVDKIDPKLFKPGEILVTNMTEPDWEPLFKKAKGVVTDGGSRTAHIAIVARELGVPAVVGTNIATKAIKTGQQITVDCSSAGNTGLVYDGAMSFVKQVTRIKRLPQTSCQILVNTGEPSRAEEYAKLPSDGIGLARLEFIINEHIKVHPLALLHPERIKRAKTRKQVESLIRKSDSKTGREFYIKQLSEGLAQIAKAFYPRKVLVRLSDFKSNEYRHLLGGSEFEPLEQNPILGWRGVARYYDPKFQDAFAMECTAIKQVRDKEKLDNINIAVPFVRNLIEAKKIITILKKHGLKRKKNGLQILMMAETPANIILADKFIQYFDGFSIGTNDLTQLILGVDRSSPSLAHLYDERNEAVKIMIKDLIDKVHQHKKTVGICGQAPSDFPEFAEFIAKAGIDSISVNPDDVLTTRMLVSKIR